MYLTQYTLYKLTSKIYHIICYVTSCGWTKYIEIIIVVTLRKTLLFKKKKSILVNFLLPRVSIFFFKFCIILIAYHIYFWNNRKLGLIHCAYTI